MLEAMIDRCSVDGCGIVATESGFCFYHDRCPPAEVTVAVAARVMHDSRFKKKECKRQVTETVTEWEPAEVTEPEASPPEADVKQLPPPQESATEMVGSLDTDCSLLGNDKYLTGILNLTLASGAGRISIFTDANIFDLSLEDRAFVFELVDMMKAYHRKHPKVPNSWTGV